MGACLFAYNLFELISTLHQPVPWNWAEDAAAALSAIPTFDLFLGFVGMSRRLRWLRRTTAVYFTTIAAMSLWRFVEPSFFGVVLWAQMMLAGVVVVFAVAGACLVRHVRQSRGLERAR
jgi:hypothetical protein